jgi:hypothetical protein
MRSSRHPTLARFEEHSLALFTALVMSSTGVMAQARETAPGEGATLVQTTGAVVPGVPRQTNAEQAFLRADTNGDRQLSRDEAQRLPAVWERFDAIDTNRDQQISRDEFDRGISK